jgi:hypothetical protein
MAVCTSKIFAKAMCAIHQCLPGFCGPQLKGLTRYIVFFVLELSTRRVEIAGITADPDGFWMIQMARRLTTQ